MGKRGLGCFCRVVFLVVVACAALGWWVMRQSCFAHGVSCQVNLKHIGYGLRMYAREHRDRFPPKLGTLGKYVSYQSSLFVCPSEIIGIGSGNEPGSFETVDEWTDYSYLRISKSYKRIPPDTVLVYCDPKNHRGIGANVLIVGGQVHWFNTKKHCGEGEISFEEVIGKAREQLKP